jgi:hypothetical protein
MLLSEMIDYYTVRIEENDPGLSVWTILVLSALGFGLVYRVS